MPYSGIPVILSTISLSTCMVPPHYIRGGTPPPSSVNQNPRVYASTWYQSYEICFRCLLQCRDGGTLKPKIGLEVLRNLPYETLKEKKKNGTCESPSPSLSPPSGQPFRDGITAASSPRRNLEVLRNLPYELLKKKKKKVLANLLLPLPCLPQGNRSGTESLRRLHPAGILKSCAISRTRR